MLEISFGRNLPFLTVNRPNRLRNIKHIIREIIVSNDPELTDKNVIYYALAERFGWLPKQVDEIDCDLIEDLLTIGQEKDRREMESMKNG